VPVEEQSGQNSTKSLSRPHVSVPSARDVPEKVVTDKLKSSSGPVGSTAEKGAAGRSTRAKHSGSNNNETRNRIEANVSAGRRDETLIDELGQDDAGSNAFGTGADDASGSAIEELVVQDPLSLGGNRTSTPKASRNTASRTVEMSPQTITVGHQMVDIQTGLVIVMSDTTTCADSIAVADEDESSAGDKQSERAASDGRLLEGKYQKIWSGCLKEIRGVVKNYQNSAVSN
jgi:hypothetical protein